MRFFLITVLYVSLFADRGLALIANSNCRTLYALNQKEQKLDDAQALVERHKANLLGSEVNSLNLQIRKRFGIAGSLSDLSSEPELTLAYAKVKRASDHTKSIEARKAETLYAVLNKVSNLIQGGYINHAKKELEAVLEAIRANRIDPDFAVLVELDLDDLLARYGDLRKRFNYFQKVPRNDSLFALLEQADNFLLKKSFQIQQALVTKETMELERTSAQAQYLQAMIDKVLKILERFANTETVLLDVESTGNSIEFISRSDFMELAALFTHEMILQKFALTESPLNGLVQAFFRVSFMLHTLDDLEIDLIHNEAIGALDKSMKSLMLNYELLHIEAVLSLEFQKSISRAYEKAVIFSNIDPTPEQAEEALANFQTRHPHSRLLLQMADVQGDDLSNLRRRLARYQIISDMEFSTKP